MARRGNDAHAYSARGNGVWRIPAWQRSTVLTLCNIINQALLSARIDNVFFVCVMLCGDVKTSVRQCHVAVA